MNKPRRGFLIEALVVFIAILCVFQIFSAIYSAITISAQNTPEQNWDLWSPAIWMFGPSVIIAIIAIVWWRRQKKGGKKD